MPLLPEVYRAIALLFIGHFHGSTDKIFPVASRRELLAGLALASFLEILRSRSDSIAPRHCLDVKL